MEEAIKRLDKKLIQFICDECGIPEEELFEMDNDTLYERVYDAMCDIEDAEIPESDDEEISERGETASEIVTELGNAMAKAGGYYDEGEEE